MGFRFYRRTISLLWLLSLPATMKKLEDLRDSCLDPLEAALPESKENLAASCRKLINALVDV